MSFDLRTGRSSTRVEFRLRLPLLLIGLAVITLVAGLGHVALDAAASGYERRIATARDEYATLAPEVERFEFLTDLEQTAAGKGNLIAAFPVRNVKWNLVLSEVALVVPESVVLTSLRSYDDGTVTVEGQVADLEALAQFGAGVQTAEYLGTPALSRAEWDAEAQAYVFTATFEVKEVSSGG